jgi:hypothetical protein
MLRLEIPKLRHPDAPAITSGARDLARSLRVAT